MVLSNPDQLDAFEHQPEKVMLNTSFIEGLAADVRAIVNEGIKEEKAFAEVSRRQRLHLGRTEDEMLELEEAITNQLLADSIRRHAERGARAVSHEDVEFEVFEPVTPPPVKPSIIKHRGSHEATPGSTNQPRTDWLTESENRHEEAHPPLKKFKKG